MKSLLVFLPNDLREKIGYIQGKIIHDHESDSKKFYVVGIQEATSFRSSIDVIGYYSGMKDVEGLERKANDWIHIALKSTKTPGEYCLKDVMLDHKRSDNSVEQTVIIVYDQRALLEAELFQSQSLSGDHFLELKEILEKKSLEDNVKKKYVLKTVRKTLLMYCVWFFMYPVLALGKITNKLLPVLKYSTLGLHLNEWLENAQWLLHTIVQDQKLSLKTTNHIFATILDTSFGILALQLLLHGLQTTPPSEIFLENAEKVVESLRSLIGWLMGSPAGLKLNHSFNTMLGKFFLYHIHLWWTFLVFIKPVMDFFFQILLLFGRLGITFQIAIAADILALVSFHTYCIYVYAARLFNVQIRGLTALFRLFLGKKKNPLRERVDSCQYQPDQLFIGTLLFTILLFLMPTTWVYYTVFTSFRLLFIAFGGFLTRLRFYFQIIPVYTSFCWLVRSRSINSSAKLVMTTQHDDGSIVLMMKTVVSPWGKTWIHCIPDTIGRHPPIEWAMIVKNIFWGHLLYPL